MANAYEILIKVMAAGGQAVAEFDKIGKSSERMARKTDDETKKAQISLDAFGKKAAVTGGALLAAAGTMAFALKGTVTSAQEAEAAQLKLQNTIDGSAQLGPKSMKAFNDQAKSIQLVTVASDEAVNGIQSMLGQFGLSERQVLSLTPLVVDISRKMGIDFVSAAKAVAKATDGSATSLKKLGINVDEAKFKLDPFQATMEALRRSAGGFAEQEGKTFAGQMAILGNQTDELKESLGRGVLSVMTQILPVVQDVTGAFIGLDDATGGAVGTTLAIGTGLAAVVGGGALVVSTVIKISTAYKTLAASQALAARGAMAAIPVVGLVIAGAAAIAVAGKVANAYSDTAGLATRSYAAMFNAKTAKDKMRQFMQASIAEGEKNASGFSNIFKTAGATALAGIGISGPLNDLVKDLGASGITSAFKKALTLDPESARSVLAYIGTHEDLKKQLLDMGVPLEQYKKWSRDTIDTNHDGTQSVEEITASWEEAAKKVEALGNAVGAAGANSRLFVTATNAAETATKGLKTAQEAYLQAVKDGDPQGIADAQLALSGALLGLAAANDAVTDAAIKQAEAQLNLQTLIKDPEAYEGEVTRLQNLADQMTGPLRDAILGRIDDLTALALKAGTKIDLNDAAMLTSLARLKDAGRITQEQIDSLLAPKTFQGFDTHPLTYAMYEVEHAAWQALRRTLRAQGAKVSDAGPEPVPPATRQFRAMGGPVNGGMPYVVGERGPELFVPRGSGSIIANNRLGGGGTFNVTVNASPLSSPADVGAAVVDALAAYNRRNGPLPVRVA
jgi:hypothetical protein